MKQQHQIHVPQGLAFGLISSIFTTGGLVFISYFQNIPLHIMRYIIFGSAVTDGVADGLGMYKETRDIKYGLSIWLFKFLFCLGFILPTFLPLTASFYGHILLISIYFIASNILSLTSWDVSELEMNELKKIVLEASIILTILIAYLSISYMLQPTE